MKPILLAAISLLSTLPTLALSVGDQVSPDALAKADFIKGEPIKAWEKGKTYVISCWATGSRSSVLTLPMLQDLHRLHNAGGLEIIAVNVGENDREKVADFLSKRGKTITHSVAFVPSGDTFQTEWVDAANVDQLPFCFVIREGRYLFGGHPAKINGPMIDAFLAGDDQLQAMLDRIEREQVTEVVIKEQLKAFSTAQRNGDAKGMENAISTIAVTSPEFVHLPRMLVDVELVRKDWSAATKTLKAIEDSQVALMSAALISRQYDTAEEQPPAELFEAVAEILKANMAEDASIKASLARVQWKLGQREEALKTARLAPLTPGPLAKGPLEDFAKSFESEEPQSLNGLIQALNAEMNKAKQ